MMHAGFVDAVIVALRPFLNAEDGVIVDLSFQEATRLGAWLDRAVAAVGERRKAAQIELISAGMNPEEIAMESRK